MPLSVSSRVRGHFHNLILSKEETVPGRRIWGHVLNVVIKVPGPDGE